MQPISIKEIISACNGKSFGCDGILDKKTQNILIDSRKVEAGDVFIAVKGENLDGHDFIGKAYKNGAIAIISEEPCNDIPYILVESTFKALKDIAEYYRSKFDVKVIGITGSVGKTTAKEMMACVLSQKFNVLKTQGNLNNEFGLPQMIFKIEPEHDVVILEMGMNHFGEISRLSKTARPDIAVIINIGESHIGNLGSRDGILKAKCEIFDYLKEDGIAILNGDDDKLITLKNSKWNPSFFGESKHNDFYVKDIKSMDENGTKFTAYYENSDLDLDVSALGKHMIYPTLAASLVAKKLGLSDEEIKKGVKNFENIGARNRMIKTHHLTILDDVYNACEESIVAGVSALELIKTNNKKIAIIGDVFEVGEYAEKIHYDIGKRISKHNIDLFICVGEDSKHTYDGIIQNSDKKSLYFKTQDEMLEKLSDIAQNGDTIYVKASRGMKLENTVDLLKKI